MSKFALELGEEQFRIVGPDGAESELADYGDLATLEIGEEKYVAMVPEAEDGDGPAPEADWDDFEGVVFRLEEEDTETREVEFEVVAEGDGPEEPEGTPAVGSGA